MTKAPKPSGLSKYTIIIPLTIRVNHRQPTCQKRENTRTPTTHHMMSTHKPLALGARTPSVFQVITRTDKKIERKTSKTTPAQAKTVRKPQLDLVCVLSDSIRFSVAIHCKNLQEEDTKKEQLTNAFPPFPVVHRRYEFHVE